MGWIRFMLGGRKELQKTLLLGRLFSVTLRRKGGKRCILLVSLVPEQVSSMQQTPTFCGLERSSRKKIEWRIGSFIISSKRSRGTNSRNTHDDDLTGANAFFYFYFLQQILVPN